MSIQRVAIIFDNKARPETTGVYCRRALGQIVQVEHFLPSERAEIPRQGFDLYLNIDDGLEYLLPVDLHPSAWWVIDTHLNFDWDLKKAAEFDFVFAAQRDGAEQFLAKGISKAQWLPLACDPELHQRVEIEKAYDVSFVGNLSIGPRTQLLSLIQARYPNSFVGQRYFEEMAKVYSASRVVFNRSIRNDVNMRVFEATACGSLLLTNDLRDNGQQELFKDGIHLVTYRDPEELLDKLEFYLKREEIRERIAAAGRAEALSRHTYRHRMEQILRAVETSESSQRTTRPTPEAAIAPSAPPDSNPPTGSSGRRRKSTRKSRSPSPAQEASHIPDIPPSPDSPSAGGGHSGRSAPNGSSSKGAGFKEVAAISRQAQWYFEFDRPEVQALVPMTARRILDIGCGAGRLGEALKVRQAAYVAGIEFDPQAAAIAATHLDHVVTGDIETMDPGFDPGSFDVVICADVLEHLRDPGRVLKRIKTWLAAGGCLVTSIPNIRHHSVVRSLISGNWTYEPAGLLDETHLRFFTRREIEKLLYRAGFGVELMHIVPGPHDDERNWQEQVRAGKVSVGVLQMEKLPPEGAEEFFVYQYLVRALPVAPKQQDLTSIVVVTHNEFRYTRQCLESIKRFTDAPHEVILVDNGSTDGTLEFLRTQVGINVVLNPENRGFAAAVNQGIAAAMGSQILLLNNDCVVTTGWLDRMLLALASDPTIGLVGPVSNSTHGAQKIVAGYDDIRDADGFAWEWAKRHQGQIADCEPLQGFCLLIARQVIDQIGKLDERFGIGGLEDDDFCLRARKAGFRTVLAQDVYIHHYGHRSFQGAGIDYDALYQENLLLFRDKWATETGCPNYGLTSIVILTHNQLDYTRQCVDSIRRHTNEPYQLIFVDNASTDGTADYLQSVPNSKLIKNAENRGFPAAANQGMRLATGQQILLLNNDCIVPANWLGPLLRALHSDAEIGMVGPCSNFVSGEQQVEASYEDIDGLNSFASRWAQANRGTLIDTSRLVGFCLLVRRAVIEKIGYLDEQFGMGCFEDDDYVLRALQAGYRAVIAREAFVHHYGGRTFVGSKVNFGELMDRNRGLFEAKWNAGTSDVNGESRKENKPDSEVLHSRSTVPDPRFTKYCVRRFPKGGLVLQRDTTDISLCMIARNNANTIGAALASVKNFVGEMIVVDTGSTDETPQIAASLGAHVEHFAWCDDFSAARNESIKYACGEWIFWMDSDDTMDAANARRLRVLIRKELDPSIMGFVMEVHCPSPGEGGREDLTVVHHVKMFRNLPELRFERRIHEQIIAPIRRLGAEIMHTDIAIIHSGADHTPEGKKRKLERDLRILSEELKDRPDSFTYFNLGMTHNDAERFEEAADYLHKSIAISLPTETQLRKSYSLLAFALSRLQRQGEAMQVCKQGLDLFPKDAELRFRQANLLHDEGKLAEAVEIYKGILHTKEDWHFSSSMPGIQGILARQNLAVVYTEMHRYSEAEEQLRLMLLEEPENLANWHSLVDNLLRQEKQREAQQHLKQILARWPADASAHHNLGSLHRLAGNPGAAIASFRESVRHRPHFVPTLRQLGYALQENGLDEEAATVWQMILELSPGDAEAKNALAES